jgi:hypothetical protein
LDCKPVQDPNGTSHALQRPVSKGKDEQMESNRRSEVGGASLAARVEDMVDSSIAKKVLQWVLTLGASLTSPWID